MKRAIAIAAAMLATSVDGAPTTASDKFEAAVLSRNVEDAIDAYHEQLLRNSGPKHVDPTADALAGRLSLMLGDPISASALFAQGADGDESNEVSRGLAHGYALLAIGENDSAAAQFERLTLVGTMADRVRASLGRAQALSATEPATSLALSQELAPIDTSAAWRLPFVRAVALLNLGQMTQARRAADAALTASVEAPLADFAPLVVQQLQAAIAVRAGDTGRTAALLAAVPSSADRASEVAKSVASRAPPCGRDGISEVDYATIMYLPHSAYPVAAATVIGASRPDVVKLFQRAVAGLWRTDLSVSVATWPMVTLRCRNADPLSYGDDQQFKRYAATLARNHVRPLFLARRFYKGDDELTAAALFVDLFESRVGNTAPALVAALTELAVMTEARAAKKGDVPVGAAQLLLDRGLVLTEQFLDENGRAIGPQYLPKATDGRPTLEDFKAWLVRAELDYAYATVANLTARKDIPEAERVAMLDTVIARLGDRRTDYRRQTMESHRVGLLRNLRTVGLDKVVAKSGMDSKLCGNQATEPSLAVNAIRDTDYPRDAIVAEIQGLTFTELDVGVGGEVSARIIASSPPLIFETGLNSRVSAFRYEPARDNRGRVVLCRAFPQTIRWQMPPGPDAVAPIVPGPTY